MNSTNKDRNTRFVSRSFRQDERAKLTGLEPGPASALSVSSPHNPWVWDRKLGRKSVQGHGVKKKQLVLRESVNLEQTGPQEGQPGVTRYPPFAFSVAQGLQDQNARCFNFGKCAGKEGSPVTSLGPSALLSGAGTSDSWEKLVALPTSVGPEQSSHRAKAQNCKEGSPLEGKSLKPGLGRRWSFREPNTVPLCSHTGASCSWKSPD